MFENDLTNAIGWLELASYFSLFLLVVMSVMALLGMALTMRESVSGSHDPYSDGCDQNLTPQEAWQKAKKELPR